MNLSIFLQLFLLADVFCIGVLVTIAVQHARAHFTKPRTVDTSVTPPITPIAPLEPMTVVVRERLQRESQKHFEDSVTTAVAELQHNLGATAAELDHLLRQLGGEIVGNELERYRVELAQLRAQAQTDLGTIKTEVSGHKAELEEQLNDELTAEKQRLIKQIDTKLGDAVSSFLLEALEHNIDLGAQEQYLLEQLEAHKADFKREVDDGNQAA